MGHGENRVTLHINRQMIGFLFILVSVSICKRIQMAVIECVIFVIFSLQSQPKAAVDCQSENDDIVLNMNLKTSSQGRCISEAANTPNRAFVAAALVQ